MQKNQQFAWQNEKLQHGDAIVFDCVSDASTNSNVTHYSMQYVGIETALRHDQVMLVAIRKKTIYFATKSNKVYCIDYSNSTNRNLQQMSQFDNLQISHMQAGDLVCMIVVNNRHIYAWK